MIIESCDLCSWEAAVFCSWLSVRTLITATMPSEKKNVFFFPLKLQVKHIHTHTFLSEARSRPHRSFVSYRNVYSFFAFPLFMASQCTPNAIHITNDAPSSGSLSVLSFFLLVFYTTFIYYPLVSFFFHFSLFLSRRLYITVMCTINSFFFFFCPSFLCICVIVQFRFKFKTSEIFCVRLSSYVLEQTLFLFFMPFEKTNRIFLNILFLPFEFF